MEKREKRDVHLVSEDALQDAIPRVVFQQPVAVVKIESLSVDDTIDGIGKHLHSKLVAKVGLQPEVVVAGKVAHVDARAREIRQLCEQPEIPLRHDGIVFEPEVEKISHDEQCLSILPHHLQEADDGTLLVSVFLSRTDAEMSV